MSVCEGVQGGCGCDLPAKFCVEVAICHCKKQSGRNERDTNKTAHIHVEINKTK